AMKSFILYILIAVTSAMLCTGCSSPASPLPTPNEPVSDLNVDMLGIKVAAGERREYSFTDKNSSFWYGQTHTDDWQSQHAGWSVGQTRLLRDYSIMTDDTPMSRTSADVTVYPYKIARTFDNGTHEEFYMFDNIEALLIKIDNITGDSIGIILSPDFLSQGKDTSNGIEFRTTENHYGVVTLYPFNSKSYSWNGTTMKAPTTAGGFLITYRNGLDSQQFTPAQFRDIWPKLLQERVTRMNDLIQYYNPLKSNLDSLDLAMAWISITSEEAITYQKNYDRLHYMLQDMTGMMLCTGQFAMAKSMLWEYARLSQSGQQLPHGTAGYFVSDVMDYLNYTADTEFLATIYPAIATAVNSILDSVASTSVVNSTITQALNDATKMALIMRNRNDFMHWSNASIKIDHTATLTTPSCQLYETWPQFHTLNKNVLSKGPIGTLQNDNAKHLLTWHHDFLGIKPRLIDETINISPAIPEAIDSLRYSQLLAHGRLEGAFERGDSYSIYAYRFINFSANATFAIDGYKPTSVKVTPGMSVELLTQNERLQVTIKNDNGTRLNRYYTDAIQPD
ncbi:MAG: hypothetical protein K2M65_01975, partial [Muribaculaceae bacterium]|nr:hypothetical protein [Muribaculaceae bacterium]